MATKPGEEYERIQQRTADAIAVVLRGYETEIIELVAAIIADGDLSVTASDIRRIASEIESYRYEYQQYAARVIDSEYKHAAESVTEEGDKRAIAAGIAITSLWSKIAANSIYRRFTQEAKRIATSVLITTAPATQDTFIDTMIQAYRHVQNGASVEQAQVWAVKRMSKAGVQYVNYASGRRDHIDVAARRSIIGNMNQYFGQIAHQRYNDLGAEIVETSAHNGARETHSEWQGRRFGFKDAITIGGTYYPDFVTMTGYGAVDGLLGINCRHSYYPVFDVELPPTYTDQELLEIQDRQVNWSGEMIPQYEAEQKQRAIERKVREIRRQKAGMQTAYNATGSDLAKQELERLHMREREQLAIYRANSARAGFREYPERMRITTTRRRVAV